MNSKCFLMFPQQFLLKVAFKLPSRRPTKTMIWGEVRHHHLRLRRICAWEEWGYLQYPMEIPFFHGPLTESRYKSPSDLRFRWVMAFSPWNLPTRQPNGPSVDPTRHSHEAHAVCPSAPKLQSFREHILDAANTYPPVMKHGWLENGPLIGDFPS